jgi:3-hydroxy-9,10-secoandrosta-1,3,5(10)-triene-9,17-dione monooxygenase
MTASATVRQQKERPSHRELVERARALQSRLRGNAAEGELLRRLPDVVNDALTEAGMFRLLTPARFGGYEVDLRTLIKVGETLGEIGGSASWLVSIGSVAAWMMGHLCSPQAQQEIFGRTPDMRAAGSSTPGSARRVDGGVRISGQWSYASGAHHADWALLAAIVTDGVTDGSQEPVEAMFCVAPAKQLLLKRPGTRWGCVARAATRGWPTTCSFPITGRFL